ncbi:MAG: rhodanese-like domain-containing protein [Calothrix sp. MO_167.B12]|nr:rhodanese-like domain-containing protein [Calothrix sp. MO_167.B12]
MSTLVRQGLPLLLAVLLWIPMTACNGKNTVISRISQSELLTEIQAKQPPVILDVRTKKEYDGGHIPGAINIDFKQLKQRINEIDRLKNSTVVVYCERGIRAKIAQATLYQAGFQSILHLEGDISAWRSKSLPLEFN